MDSKAFGKNLLLSFLPILIFVVADEYLSQHFPEDQATKYAIALALGLGLIQALYVFLKERRLDKMLLLDTALIVGLGGVSLLSGDEIFFKIKPALVQFLMVIGLGFVAFLKPKLLLAMTGRFMSGREVPDEQLKAMQQSTKGLVVVLLLHTLLIVYAAFYMSKAAWAFISGPLIYIVALLYFFAMLLLNVWRRRAIRSPTPEDSPKENSK